jgi:hypothetical protein
MIHLPALLSGCLLVSSFSGLARADLTPPATPIVLGSPDWHVEISPASGGIEKITSPRDTNEMNWVHADRLWGIVRCQIASGQVVAFDHPSSVAATSSGACDSIYSSSNLRLVIHRAITGYGRLVESYSLSNTGKDSISLPEGAVSITVPFNDSYKAGTPTCLTQNCNAHLWPGGASSWANAIRMDGDGPNLGLVLTEGNLANYCILDGADTNDRGNLAFNPSAIELRPGEASTLSWTLFWHADWSDFWSFLATQPSFVRLQAAHYTVVKGETIQFSADSNSLLKNAVLRVNDTKVPISPADHHLIASIKADHLGNYVFDLKVGSRHSWMRANAIEDPMALCEARVRFIVEKQQKNAPGDPLDGAYIPYDNQAENQFSNQGRSHNHNEGRERVGMGVLVALYLPLCHDPALKRELEASLDRYEGFVQRELQDETGMVYNEAGRQGIRPYNFPWMAHLHLAAYWATGDKKYLDLFLKTYRAYYALNLGNYANYTIGNQMLDGLRTLSQAGLQSEHDELLGDFKNHANLIAKIGTDYPKSEVNYEQSIVAPGVQISLEMYLVTKNPDYLESARKQLKCLEAFNGQQPDYHLNHIGIRHWDDYWFGKLSLFGDTFPHYWTTITAVAFDEYADATGDESYRTRAREIFLANMCLFTPEGRGYCAYVYPMTLNGKSAAQFDPWANDQDWVFAKWLTIYNRHQAGRSSMP